MLFMLVLQECFFAHCNFRGETCGFGLFVTWLFRVPDFSILGYLILELCLVLLLLSSFDFEFDLGFFCSLCNPLEMIINMPFLLFPLVFQVVLKSSKCLVKCSLLLWMIILHHMGVLIWSDIRAVE